MNTRKLLYIAAAAVALASCRGVEHSEQVTSEIEAAQIEGRRYAADVVRQDWSRSPAGLRAKLDSARARRDLYIKEGMNDKAAAFDSTFRSTVRAVQPDLLPPIDN